jgi:hypothetical protein
VTNDKIINVVRETVQKYARRAYDIDVSVLRRDGDDFTVRLERMYEYVDMDFATLSALSDRFNTKLIDISNKEFHGGCDTCDYGSSYWIDLSVRKASLTPVAESQTCNNEGCEYCGTPRR